MPMSENEALELLRQDPNAYLTTDGVLWCAETDSVQLALVGKPCEVSVHVSGFGATPCLAAWNLLTTRAKVLDTLARALT